MCDFANHKEILEPAVDAQKSLGDVNGGGEKGTMMIEEEDYARYLGVLDCNSGVLFERAGEYEHANFAGPLATTGANADD